MQTKEAPLHLLEQERLTKPDPLPISTTITYINEKGREESRLVEELLSGLTFRREDFSADDAMVVNIRIANAVGEDTFNYIVPFSPFGQITDTLCSLKAQTEKSKEVKLSARSSQNIHFLIQADGKKLSPECAQMISVIEAFQSEGETASYELCQSVQIDPQKIQSGAIPFGSKEFVQKAIAMASKKTGWNIRPLNIPKVLSGYVFAGRQNGYRSKKDLLYKYSRAYAKTIREVWMCCDMDREYTDTETDILYQISAEMWPCREIRAAAKITKENIERFSVRYLQAVLLDWSENKNRNHNMTPLTFPSTLYVRIGNSTSFFAVYSPNELESQLKKVSDSVSLFWYEDYDSPVASQWRVFVHGKDIVGIQPVSIDKAWVMPNQNAVSRMIDTWEGSPPAYALDVHVLEDGRTVLASAEKFISCKLYGLDSASIIKMAKDAYLYEVSRIQVEN